MKISKIIFILSLFLTINYTNAQSINDSIFNNVIEITDNNTGNNGTDYLFNISIPKSIEIPIIFVQKEVPPSILPIIYPEFSKLIVITPNWTYYAKNSNQVLPEGVICAEPMASSIVYEFNRENGKVLKDSLVIMGDFPNMKFKEPKKQKDNEIEVFYEENFGSACCPKDPKWKIKDKLGDFITAFEKSNKVKIGDVYKKMIGEEGEHNLYFTLSNLNSKQKLEFLQEVRYWIYIDRHLEDIRFKSQIFTPSFIKKEGLKLITEK